MEVDVLPGRSSVECEFAEALMREMDTGEEIVVLQVRFRAVEQRWIRRRRWRKREHGWSGWFIYEGDPIKLRWEALVGLAVEDEGGEPDGVQHG